MKMKFQTLLVMLFKKKKRKGGAFNGLGRWEFYRRVSLAHLLPNYIPKRVQKTHPSLEVASHGGFSVEARFSGGNYCCQTSLSDFSDDDDGILWWYYS